MCLQLTYTLHSCRFEEQHTDRLEATGAYVCSRLVENALLELAYWRPCPLFAPMHRAAQRPALVGSSQQLGPWPTTCQLLWAI